MTISRWKKGFVTALLSLTVAAALAGCGGGKGKDPDQKDPDTEKSADPIQEMKENMVKGYYFTENKVVAATGLKTFIHFSADGTYYFMAFDGGFLDAGQWDLVEKAVTYTTPGPDGDYYKDDGADNEEATSEYAVEFRSYQSNLGTYYHAYADDKVWDINPGGLSAHNTFGHVADYAYDPKVDEKWTIPVRQARVGDDDTLTLILFHDKSFEDFTGDEGVYGTWEMISENEYKLTTEDGEEAKVVYNGEDATYTNPKGEEVALKTFTKTILEYAE